MRLSAWLKRPAWRVLHLPDRGLPQADVVVGPKSNVSVAVPVGHIRVPVRTCGQVFHLWGGSNHACGCCYSCHADDSLTDLALFVVPDWTELLFLHLAHLGLRG